MVPFSSRVGERAIRETRVLTVLEPSAGLPRGEFAFFELFCEDPTCDCRRVHLRVVSGPPHHRVMANINFGWETPEFYGEWGWTDGSASGAFLDPLNEQSRYAPAFLDYFVDVMLADEDYVQRLIRHYSEFKATLPAGHATGGNRRARRAARPRAERSPRTRQAPRGKRSS